MSDKQAGTTLALLRVCPTITENELEIMPYFIRLIKIGPGGII